MLWMRAAALLVSIAALQAEAQTFTLRGVIFGPYGRVWSHADRMEMIRWMAREDVGMNVYVHAPKNDVYQRLQWRDAYPPEILAEFLEETALATSLGVAWVPNVSPGVPLIPSPRLPTGVPSTDVCFSCPEEVDVIVEKFSPFFDAGARTFMISFDDVQKISTHAEDALAYVVGDGGPRTPDEAYGRMNADLLNRVLAALEGLSDDVELLTVPADYSGTAQTAYLKGFSDVIDCRVRVMWTGTAVVSHTVPKGDAALYRNAVWPAGERCDSGGGRPKLLMWDNYPVNDYNGNALSGPLFTPIDVGDDQVVAPSLPTAFKLNVGPYKGRSHDLVEEVDGILANPMSEAEASKLPLYTVAAYLRDPAPYTAATVDCPEDPDNGPAGVSRASCEAERAWLAGIASFGGAAGEPLLDFVNQMRSSPLDRTESPVFVKLSADFLAAFATAFWSESWDALATELERERDAPGVLRSDLGNGRFLDEARHHLGQLVENASVGLLAVDLLAAERPSVSVRSVVRNTDGSVELTGSAVPVDLARFAGVLAKLTPRAAAMRMSPYSVHGDRFQQDLGTAYVGENRMDDFLDAAAATTAAWLPLAPRAATGALRVTVDDVAVPVSSDGSFRATIGTPGPTIAVVVTDAAGFATGIRVSAPD